MNEYNLVINKKVSSTSSSASNVLPLPHTTTNAIRATDQVRQTHILDTGASNIGPFMILDMNLRALTKRVKEIEEPTASIVNTRIFNLGEDGYELTESIDAVLTIEDDCYYASIPDLELYGEGNTDFEAVNDLKIELLDLFDNLNNISDSELSKKLKAHKSVINHLIRTTDDN